MTMPNPGGYRQFEQAVLDPLLAYRRAHDPELLAASASALATLGEDAGSRARLADTVEFRVSGWLLPSITQRLSKAHLENRNPGYRVALRRMAHAGLGRRARLLRAGFVVTARGSATAPPFRLVVTGRGGATLGLPGSNFTANYQLAGLALDRAPDAAATGYIDEIRISPVPDDSDRSTWLAAILHAHPQELFEIVDSPVGRFVAEAVGRLIQAYPLNARWADRFTMSVRGAAGKYRSDFEPLSIDRVNEMGSPAPDERMPEPTRTGRTVRWAPGEVPIIRPDSPWFRLEDTAVQDGGTVTVPGTLVVYERSADPANDFVAGQQFTVFGSSADREIALLQRRPAAATRVDEGILLAGRSDENWYHWLIEYLPRVLSIPATIGDDVPLIVTPRTPATGMQALSELSGRPVVVIDPLESTAVGILHLQPPPVQVIDTTYIPWAEGLRLHSGALHRMRERWGLTGAWPAATRRIFLRRTSSHRGLGNEDVLAAVADSHGLEIVDPGTLSFAEQRELFSSAELLAGASGAVMANYIMMRPGSQVIGLTSDQLYDFVLPAALAAVVGAEFTYVTGPSARGLDQVEDLHHWILEDFEVDPSDFEAELVAAIGRLETNR